MNLWPNCELWFVIAKNNFELKANSRGDRCLELKDFGFENYDWQVYKA